MSIEIKIPKLGENIEGGNVTSVLVKAGDAVRADQALLEMETGKATMEIPSPHDGVIVAVTIKPGDYCKVGQVIGTLTAAGEAPAAATPAHAPATAPAKPAPAPAKPAAPTAPASSPVPRDIVIPNLGDGVKDATVQGLLVKPGDTVKADQGLLEVETGKATVEIPSPADGVIQSLSVKPGDKVRPGDKAGVILAAAAPSGSLAAPAAPETPAPTPSAGAPRVIPPAPAPDTEGRTAPYTPPPERPRHAPVPAAPSVRKFARELGLDVREIPGTGPGGRISIADIKAHQKRLNTGGAVRAGSGALAAPAPLPDFSRFGETEREPMNAIRKVTVRHLSSCWATIPHVTQFDQADTTQLELVRQAYTRKAGEGGVKVTLTALLVKLLARALQAHPKFNASVDLLREEIVYKRYIHIGIAVDTPKGLLVPVIQNAAAKGVLAIARDLGVVAEKARKGRISPDDLSGGCMSITNLGGLGGKHFTPIINAPEVAILGVGRATPQPVWADGAFVARPLLPLSLSYDHRLIDGADGTRFLRWLVDAIEQPIAHLLEDNA